MAATVIRWQGLQLNAREHLVLQEDDDCITADSIYLSEGGADSFGVRYRLVCNKDWTVRQFRSEVLGKESSELILHRDQNGRWTNGAEELPELAGATDIDLAISPFTNTLPIRRLRLAPGQSADIVTAYVVYPEHSVMADPQRYSCLSTGRYRFESVDTDFKRVIEVDEQGLVTMYPDLFARI
ncbi:MAG: putative glycolipid-binding domain-containing protein [Candidatus Obscuribacterales bacterium]|nr:putative glycolipid-binding domain-containing protein [Candidatus Obscuribacterales bacterium]